MRKTVAGARFEKVGGRGPLLEDEVRQKSTNARETSISSAEKEHSADAARTLVDLCGFAADCDKTHWHGCTQESIAGF